MKFYFYILLLAITLFSCNNESLDNFYTTCSTPTNVQFTNLTAESVTISWETENTTTTYLLEYGETGFAIGSGTQLTGTSTSSILTNLLANTTYDVYVQELCDTGNTSMFSTVTSFTTALLETCLPPTNFQIENTTYDTVTLNWDAVEPNANYTLEYGSSDFTLGNGTTINTNLNTITITGLTPLTNYDFYITTTCENGLDSEVSTVLTATTDAPPVIPEFLPLLSDLNLFIDLPTLTANPNTFQYELNTALFTDYAYKQRLVALPEGAVMEYNDDGLPTFPDNTLISKTFYYYLDETNTAASDKKIIETRILIKIDGQWQAGNYVWNAAQTDATLNSNANVVSFSYIKQDGSTTSLDYEIPSHQDCLECHLINGRITPIGPKLRNLKNNNQIDNFISEGILTGISNAAVVTALPNWEDTSYTLEERTRAYFDVNCAHCHNPEGSCYPESNLDMRFETPFDDTHIFEHRFSIETRTQSLIPAYGMPLIGTTILHPEGYTMIQAYVQSL